MRIVADTHVHLYDAVHPLPAMLRRLATRLDGHASALGSPADSVRLACLVECAGDDVYGRLATGGGLRELASGIDVIPAAESGALLVTVSGASPFYLIAGRQVVTSERLELLALACAGKIPDGLSAVATVGAIRDAGGIPVVGWAPGKWFFGRGRVVRGLIERFSGAGLLVGDTSLRPLGWPVPRLFAFSRQQGGRVVCGSDPLPFAGDACNAAGYACWWDAPFDEREPVSSLRTALRGGAEVHALGRRSAPVAFVRRMWGHRQAKRARALDQ